jgi:hypothetical protein
MIIKIEIQNKFILDWRLKLKGKNQFSKRIKKIKRMRIKINIKIKIIF